jgi:hypothetical protein
MSIRQQLKRRELLLRKLLEAGLGVSRASELNVVISDAHDELFLEVLVLVLVL